MEGQIKMAATMTASEVVELLELCRTEKEWEEACRMIKDDNGGEYPGFWREEILRSGVAQRVCSQWPSF